MNSLPSFSDSSLILLTMLFFANLILLPSGYFGGKVGLVVAAIVLTAITAFLYIYMLALGKSFANGNSNSTIDIKHIISFIAFACFYAFMAYGAFMISQMLKGEASYGWQIIGWLVVCLSFPLFDYSQSYYGIYSYHQEQKKYYSTDITIAHPKNFPILIDQLNFINSKGKTSSSTSLTKNAELYRDDQYVKRFEGIDVESNENLRYLQSHLFYSIGPDPTPSNSRSTSNYSRARDWRIPTNFDAFELSWYSVADKKFYKDTFPLDQKKLDIKDKYGGGREINDLLINILPTGHVDLLKRKSGDLLHTIPYWDIAFTQLESEDLTEILTHFSTQNLTGKYLEMLTDTYAKALITITEGHEPNEVLKFRSVQPFGIDIKFKESQSSLYELRRIEVIDFYLNEYARSAKTLKKVHTLALPSHFEINFADKNNDWSEINIAFDKASLFEQFNHFKEKNTGDIYFDVTLDKDNLRETEVVFKANESTSKITGWEIFKR